jgi:tetratricopeptide (TPR) repeat protein
MKKPSELSRSRDRAAAAIDDTLRLGVKALEEQHAPEAERLAREALARDSRHPDALHLLGVALLAQKRAREAIAPLEQAARERSSSRIETHLGKALLESGRDSEALARLQRAIQCQPPFVPAFQELGILLSSMRRLDEAEAVLKRGLEAEPTSVELLLDLGTFYIVRVDAKNAKIAFARALANAPRNPRALHGIGVALLFEGEIERAVERFRQVLAIQPNTSARSSTSHTACCSSGAPRMPSPACARWSAPHRNTTARRSRPWCPPAAAGSGCVEALPPSSSNPTRKKPRYRSDCRDDKRSRID